MTIQDMSKIYKKYIKLHHKADRYFNNKQYMQAIECYRKAIKINPNSDAAYCNMGISFECLKQYKDAIKCYDKAIKLNPNDHRAYHNKALSLASIGHTEIALEYYEKAMDLNPQRYEDMYNEAINKSDEEIYLEYREEIEEDITKEIGQYINQGGLLN